MQQMVTVGLLALSRVMLAGMHNSICSGSVHLASGVACHSAWLTWLYCSSAMFACNSACWYWSAGEVAAMMQHIKQTLSIR